MSNREPVTGQAYEVEKCGQSRALLARKATAAYGSGVRLSVDCLKFTAMGALLHGCSGSTAPYTADADRGSTHALVTVERREVFGKPEASESKAFASFVRAPPEVDAALVTRIAGRGLEPPEPGECSLPVTGHDSTVALSPLRRVELLDAGDVTLETPAGRVALAPRAFPAVTDLVGGVVYTTRDRAARLPAAEPYALSTAGSPSLLALGVSAEAPPVLESILIDGKALGISSALSQNGSSIAWKAGSPRDLVYVTLTDLENSRLRTCAFRDDAGFGFLPANIIPSVGPVNLSLHRLRSVAIGGAPQGAIDAGELRFDFELSAEVAVLSE